MRKILTFVAALCCTMFLSVNSVMALTPFSDGVEIEIAGVDAGAAADASDILGDGTVYYDATSHILTLDAAEIYGPIYIDGSAISDVVTIEVKSYCLVRATNIHAIQYVGVEGLEIIGNDDSNILTADVLGSSNDYCAILCADAPDGTNATPLTVGGIRLNAGNDQLSSPSYSPIVCDRYYFDECMLSISTSAAREAITTFNLPNILEKVVLMDQSAYGQTNLVGLHYNEAFPVWVDGVQMHDGLNTNSDGFYVMSSTMNEKEYLSSIKEGGIGYDPATRTVWLYNGFELESRNLNAAFALEIGDATSENFYLKAAGWPYQTHKIQGLENSPTYRGGLFLHDNLTIDINGMDVEFFSQKYPAVFLDNNDLTIVNSGDRDKMLLIQSDDDKGLDGPGNLTIDHCKVEFDAKKELCSDLTSFTLNGVKVDGTSYEKGAGGIVDAGTTNWAKNAVADIIPAAWFLTVNVDPKPAAGSVEAKNSSEVVLSLPYEYSADEDVTVSATENPGWSFLQWESGSVANPRTVSLEAGYDANLTAYFVRNIESDKRFYAIAEMGEIYSIDEKLRGMPADLSLQLPIGSGNNLRRAVFAANKIFFTEENGINLSLSVIDFDGEHLGASATELLAMQDRFNPIRAMVYSESESLFYAIAHDNTATADVLISITLDGTVTPIGQLPPELDTYVRAMAINAAGDLYVVIDYAGAQLYKLDKATVAGTLIGTMPGIMGLPTYYQVNLVFDNTTDELIFSTDMPTKLYLVNPATADVDPISEVSMGFNALFQLSAAPTPDPSVTKYPVYVCGKQLTSKKATLTSSDLAAITAGSVSYDEASATLTLNAATINMTATGNIIKADNGETVGNALNVVINGDCKLTAADVAMSFRNFKSVKLSNVDASSKLTIKASHGIQLNVADLVIEGLQTTVDATTTGIAGTENEALSITGAKVSVKGASDGSIIKIKSLATEYCSIDANHEFVAANKQVEKTGTGTVAKDEVKFEPYPMIIVKPLEEGTGHFELSSGNVKFTDKGWFQAGAEIKIVAKAATGFEFSHWTDDTGWKDPASKVKATEHDNITMPATDKTYDKFAVFYYKPKSTATWYGVNDGNFISFKMTDFGANVKKASGPSATNVKAGDYVRNNWYIINNTTAQTIQFSSLADGKDLKDPKDMGAVSESFTDMAYDLLGNKIYAVAGTKLYTIKEADGTTEEVAECQYEGAAKKIEAIAIDANRNFYLLSSDDGGVLYTAPISKIKDKKLPLSFVGDAANAGKIGVAVDAGKEQSIAFDYATGELFWGAKDYIRYINPKTAKANIAGDLEQKEGGQGYIKAMHNLAKAVYAYVKVAEGQDAMGTVSIDGDNEKKVIAGTTFTIKADANSGYHFSYWEIAGESNVTESTYETSIKSETTFIAHFEEGKGIRSITIDPTLKIQKVLIDGVIYIVRDGRVYTTTGQLMK